jgi:hypothetical protein
MELQDVEIRDRTHRPAERRIVESFIEKIGAEWIEKGRLKTPSSVGAES